MGEALGLSLAATPKAPSWRLRLEVSFWGIASSIDAPRRRCEPVTRALRIHTARTLSLPKIFYLW